jgi:hypothetical protein
VFIKKMLPKVTRTWKGSLAREPSKNLKNAVAWNVAPTLRHVPEDGILHSYRCETYNHTSQCNKRLHEQTVLSKTTFLSIKHSAEPKRDNNSDTLSPVPYI